MNALRVPRIGDASGGACVSCFPEKVSIMRRDADAVWRSGLRVVRRHQAVFAVLLRHNTLGRQVVDQSLQSMRLDGGHESTARRKRRGQL
jgi:hypothetical protein